MKNLILFLAVLLISLSSCMKEQDSEFTVYTDFSYITKDANGLLIARTFNQGSYGFITSPEIKKMNPGEFKFLTYRWATAMGSVTSSDGISIYNVQVSPDILGIDSTSLKHATVPTPEVPNHFMMLPVAFDPFTFFDDNWLIQYNYKKGEDASLDFYMNEPTENNPDEYIIDVVMTKNGTASGNQVIEDYIVVDLSDIRNRYSATGSSYKNLSIKFRYYRENEIEPYITKSYTMSVFTSN